MKHTWVFNWWYRTRLRKLQGLQYKMKNETDAVKSNCISEILSTIEPLFVSIKRIIYKLGIKVIQNNRSRIHRDEATGIKILPNPLYSQNQISQIKRNYWFEILVLFGFISAESSLFYINAALFVPGGSVTMKVIVAFFLAMLSMVAIDYAFKNHFKYRKLTQHLKRNEQDNYLVKQQNDKRRLGYFFLFLAIAATICAAISRIFFLENIEVSGLSPEKQHAVAQASKWGSVLTFLITVITALLLAAIKQEQAITSEKYGVLQYWRKAHKRRNGYTQELIQNSEKIFSIVERTMERHWCLILDLKRVYKLPQEHDQRFDELNREYTELKSRPGFTINENVYRKFSPVCCAHEELFKYGIINSPELRDKLTLLNSAQRTVTEYLAGEITAIHQQTPHEQPLSLNGKQKETIIEN